MAADRAVKAIEEFGLPGPLKRWTRLRAEIQAEILDKGYDKDRRTFTQFYGSTELDAALLMVPLVGFLPPDDERVIGTVAAIEQHLMVDGFVHRYTQHPGTNVDGRRHGWRKARAGARGDAPARLTVETCRGPFRPPSWGLPLGA